MLFMPHKQRLSPRYLIFSLMTSISKSFLGSFYFRHSTKRDPETRFGKYWWHFYLINFVLNGGLDREKQPETPIKIISVKEYNFIFYNVCFHLCCLSHLLYEYANGNLPVLKDKFGIWDTFFEQPFECEIPEQTSTIKQAPFISHYMLVNKNALRAWQIATQFFLRFNQETTDYIDRERAHVLSQGKKVLGVVCRGTDYVTLKPAGHPAQPQVHEVIALCRKWMNKYQYDKIYLATEDSSIMTAFEAAFPGQILTNKRSYYDKQMKERKLTLIIDVQFDRENDNYYKGLEYLSSIHILSQCPALIGGNCGASQMAVLLNNGHYEKLHIFDKGLY